MYTMAKMMAITNQSLPMMLVNDVHQNEIVLF